jgi:hypothetical protein
MRKATLLILLVVFITLSSFPSINFQVHGTSAPEGNCNYKASTSGWEKLFEFNKENISPLFF